MSKDLGELLEVSMAYLFLGLYEEAWTELDALPSVYQVEAPVYSLRIEILQKLERWEPARVIAESLAGSFPEEAGWWLAWAYAARRETSVESARDVLRQAITFHPEDAYVIYNLACYLCVLGEVDEALSMLPRAFEMDAGLKNGAKADPDLVAIFSGGTTPDGLMGDSLLS